MTSLSPNQNIRDLTPRKQDKLYESSWFLSTSVSGVSEDALPWMLAQGWEISHTFIDKTVYPWVYSYNMRRTVPQNWNILQRLLNELTQAYNDGREANNTRYQDILSEWDRLLVRAQDDASAFSRDKLHTEATGYVTLMMATTDSLMNDYDTHKEETDNSPDEQDRKTELDALKLAMSNVRDTLQTEFDNVKVSYSVGAITADVDTAIDKFGTAVDSFNHVYATLAVDLRSDFVAHQGTARGLLVGLGATELARINEHFDNLLSKAGQGLVSRGLYSSGLLTSFEVRIERERNEAIAALNDKLARENLGNEHQLYQQGFQSRLAGLEGGIKSIEAASQIAELTMRHGQWSVDIRHKLLELETNMRMMLLGTKERYYKLLIENMDWQDRRREALFGKLLEIRMRQFEIHSRVCDKEMEFLRYRVDERSKLALGFFGVMERRQDTYPDVGQMAQLVSSLSDGGLVTP